MFVDTAKVKLQAGKGGDGAVSFRHEIYIPKGGPDGGDGGKGGSIIFRADKDTNTLLDFRFNPELTAEDGKNGSGQRSAGRSGKDLIVEVPVGTLVRRIVDGVPGPLLADLAHDQEEAVIAKGGDGGFGNAHFKSSTRQAPIIAEVGEPGDAFEAALELKLIADVGLVGLPNAGKSTFLSCVSAARPEIADYPFTTLTPQLGVATIDGFDLLIADIPGLIAGAADGKGLGHDFLRHVDRTAVLLHLIDVYDNDAGEAYRVIRGELDRYSDLKDRPEIVALTKCEGVDVEIIAMQRQAILAVNPAATVFAISAPADIGLTDLLRALKQQVVAHRANAAANAGASASAADVAGVSTSTADVAGVSTSAADASVAGSDTSVADVDASALATPVAEPLPVITLGAEHLSKAWHVEKVVEPVSAPDHSAQAVASSSASTAASGAAQPARFIVTGPKIEKFARRTDLNNYASVNRLRDILKKLGIRAELTAQGAQPDSIISIAGKEFTLVEDY